MVLITDLHGCTCWSAPLLSVCNKVGFSCFKTFVHYAGLQVLVHNLINNMLNYKIAFLIKLMGKKMMAILQS